MQGDLTPRLRPVVEGANMTDLWTNAGRPRPGDEDLKQSLWRVCSEFFSRPLTIAWGMRLFGLNPYSKPLTVHLVGAGQSETLAARLTDYDELNKMFPGHQGIEIVMVGPEVVDGPIVRPPLRAFGPKQSVYISAFKGLYHQFWEEVVEKEDAAKPDLVVGFHPGENSFHYAHSHIKVQLLWMMFDSFSVQGSMPDRAWTRVGFLHFFSSGIMRFLHFSLLSGEKQHYSRTHT